VLVTDLGILKPDAETRELTLVSIHPGVTVEQAKAATGWPLQVAADLIETPPPTAAELQALRALKERTRLTHGED
jgi:glutaconate CoA-transferase subunit B